jgi:SAM-dependent methyltransferase
MQYLLSHLYGGTDCSGAIVAKKESSGRIVTMPSRRSDYAWKRMGEVEPYYGVKPESVYLKRNLDEEARAEFFRSGEEQVEEMLRIIREHFDPNFTPSRALDYGCGVERVLVPLARRVKDVVGCDVSPPMLKESKANCDRYGLTNVSYATADDRLSAVQGTYEFIFSNAVFQHINPDRVDMIVESLLDRLEHGGICVLGFVIDTPLLRRIARWTKRSVPLVDQFVTRVLDRLGGVEVLESHVYPLERLAGRLMEAGYTQMHVQFFRGPHVTRARAYVQRGTRSSSPSAGG